MTTSDDVSVRVIDADIESQSLEEDVLVHDEIRRLLQVLLGAGVDRLMMILHQTQLRHFDHVLELPWLLFDFGRKEKGRGCHCVPMKMGERVKNKETVHVYHSRVDAQLIHMQTLAHILDQVGRLLPAGELFRSVIAVTAGRCAL